MGLFGMDSHTGVGETFIYAICHSSAKDNLTGDKVAIKKISKAFKFFVL